MANLLLQRYVNGEHREVWQDLLRLGAAVRSPELYPTSLEVAAETIKRARHNVELIIPRLEQLGYQFTQEPPSVPLKAMAGGQVFELGDMNSMLQQMSSIAGKFSQPGFTPANNYERSMAEMAQRFQKVTQLREAMAPALDARKAQEAERHKKNAAQGALKNPDVFQPPSNKEPGLLDKFERQIGGPLPISLRQWYEQVGVVNLMGLHEALNPADGPVASDPLVMEPYRDAFEAFYDGEEEPEDGFDLPLAPDALHKSHTSGGDPYSMKVPNPSADGVFSWDFPDTYFVDYLRLVFAWGGFPGWKGQPSAPQKEIEFLKEGLLAI